jgi:hypothetical protein
MRLSPPNCHLISRLAHWPAEQEDWFRKKNVYPVIDHQTSTQQLEFTVSSIIAFPSIVGDGSSFSQGLGNIPEFSVSDKPMDDAPLANPSAAPDINEFREKSQIQ